MPIKIKELGSNGIELSIDDSDVLSWPLQRLKQLLLLKLQGGAALYGSQAENMRLLHKGQFIKVSDELACLQAIGLVDGSTVFVRSSAPQGTTAVPVAAPVVVPVAPVKPQSPVAQSQESVAETERKRKRQQREEREWQRLEKIKRAAEEMSSRTHGGTDRYERYYFTIEDQSGKSISLPDHVRRNIIKGLMLQQKAQEFLRIKKWHFALELLREADTALRSAPIDILLITDNFGILQCDLVWCMYHLQDPSLLAEAEQRLQLCEQTMKNVHGTNFERLRAIAPKFAVQALYARLHLMQAVVAYHKENSSKFLEKILRANSEYEALNYSNENLQKLQEMGYTKKECIIALRSAKNIVENALEFILQKREEKLKKEAEEMARHARRQKQIQMGLCRNGELFNLDLYENLCARLGSQEDPDIVAAAVRLGNNSEISALQLLAQNRNSLERAAEEFVHTLPPAPLSNLQTVMSITCREQDICEYALKKARNNVEQAVTLIFENLTIRFPPAVPNYAILSDTMQDENGASAAAAAADDAEAEAQDELPPLEAAAPARPSPPKRQRRSESSGAASSEASAPADDDSDWEDEEDEERDDIEDTINSEIVGSVRDESEMLLNLEEDMSVLQTYMGYR